MYKTKEVLPGIQCNAMLGSITTFVATECSNSSQSNCCVFNLLLFLPHAIWSVYVCPPLITFHKKNMDAVVSAIASTLIRLHSIRNSCWMNLRVSCAKSLFVSLRVNNSRTELISKHFIELDSSCPLLRKIDNLNAKQKQTANNSCQSSSNERNGFEVTFWFYGSLFWDVT